VHSAPPSKRWILLCGLCLLASLAPARALAAGTTGPARARAAGAVATARLQADLGRQLTLAGPHDGAYVYDLSAERALFSRRASTVRPPASVEKLYTATAALAQLGPSATLQTTVYGVGALGAGGVWEGDLYLRGAGDPTFGSSSFIAAHYGGVGASVSTLVTALRNAGIHRVTGAIYGDDGYLDPLRGEPSSAFAFDPFLEGTLSALAFDRGASGSERGAHAPAAYAARKLRQALTAQGVRVGGSSAAAATPAGAVELAALASPSVAELLGLMLPPSDNFFAEMLLKDLGARFAGAGTTAAGAAIVAQTIAALLAIRPRIVDGSGLSPADRTSPRQVVELLVKLAPSATGAVLREHMAIAGRTGTLALRMRHTGAAGHCQGKTGTLTGVSNLVGYCRSADGHELAFAFFTDGISTRAAHVFQDHMTITLANSSF
jgi:serine-type D-Ala-D-Ala carboxypeptidase/endopeptidase (penicillin-binding protein 4)